MTVMVTGGAGYIGSHMVWELLDHNEKVVVVDNLVTGFEWSVPSGVTFVKADIGDQSKMEALLSEHNVDAIIHFAGSVVVPESLEDPLKYYRNNTGNSRNLIEAAINTGVKRFIFSSTAAVYGEPLTTGPIAENAILNPMSPYGTSKLMTELMIRDASAAHDLHYVILRYFNVAGCDLEGRTGQSTAGATHLIKVACEAAAGKRPMMKVFGTDYDTEDGSCIRDFIHVNDLVNAHYVALNFLRNGGQKFTANCGYSRGYSVLDVIKAVKRVSGNDFRVVKTDRRAGDIPALTANSNRLRTRLEWEPKHDDLDLIVSSALEWEKKLLTIRKSA
ncbi:MAG: UDP-glucose 4-epimerase GalE [Rhizobiaceae bacterium]|nr:UDP-glucose 4-epimerase GalE [Rhizobiaceae bacterium]